MGGTKEGKEGMFLVKVGVLGVEKNKIKGEKCRIVKGEMKEGNEITEEDVDEAINRVKGNKAIGEDGMENEAMKYGGEGISDGMWKICNKFWKGQGWPEEWMTGLMVPLVKKGEGKKVKECRGITLMKEKRAGFLTGRGLRQGCPLNPLLFNILLADLEENLKEKEKGGTVLGNSELFSLAYADDVVPLQMMRRE
ncbi:uncharacterized protein LOC117176683 [Belonocnema kinseyi]|uniref:uncharacterized protein LOC117176683 n=1 Tax=Belonocnema kinseyi TaxID=2817044 RepID=UPI00143D2D85|nr:uncharacterized protein LOC117176683 [Belonocnema kinseyi]